MTRKARILLGLFILAVSISLLVLAFKPLDREIRTQPIQPVDLQLPTPISLLTSPEPAS